MNKIEKNFIRDLRRQRIYPARRKCGDITLMEDQSRLVFSCYECDLETYSIQNFLTHTLQTHSHLSPEQITMIMGQLSDDEEEICDELGEEDYELEKEDLESTEDEKYARTIYEKIEIEPATPPPPPHTHLHPQSQSQSQSQENGHCTTEEDKWPTEFWEQCVDHSETEDGDKHDDMDGRQLVMDTGGDDEATQDATLNGDEQEQCLTEMELLEPESDKTIDKVKADYTKLLNDGTFEDLPKTLVVVDETGTTYLCGLCDRTFKVRERYKLHVRRHMGIRPYACEYCDATFVDSSNWGTHTKRHLNIKPHICEYCSKGFISTTELKHHVRSHTGERPYKCTECDRAFKTSTLLNKHFRRHTNERPHVCPTCGKQFFDSTHLKDHELTHTKIKSHACELCDSKFGRRKALLQHMKLHSGVKQYTCKICFKSFAQGPGLYSHMKTHRKVGKAV